MSTCRRNFIIIIVIALQLTDDVKSSDLNPGMVSRITSKGFKFLNDAGVTKMEELIKGKSLPSQSGKSHGVSYRLWNLAMIGLKIPMSSVSPRGDNEIEIKASYIAASMSGKYKFKKGIITYSGTFIVIIEKMSLSFNIAIDADKQGHPRVSSDAGSCQFNAGEVTVNTKRSKFIRKKMAEAIQNFLNGNACGKIAEAINTGLENYLRNLPMVKEIHDGLELDFSLLRSPVVNSSGLNIMHKGEVFATGHHTEAPDPIPDIAMDTDKSRMFFVWISDYVINSLGYVLHDNGFLRYNVTNKDVPPGSKLSLNTSQLPLSMLFPQVSKKYPNKMMQFHVVSAEQPFIKTTPEKVFCIVNVTVSAYVSQPNKSLTYLFTLGSALDSSFTVAFKGQNITWVAQFESIDLELIDSAIGDLKINMLKSLLPTAIKKFAIPKINTMGSTGILIPKIQDYQLNSAFISQGTNFLKIGADLRSYGTKHLMI